MKKAHKIRKGSEEMLRYSLILGGTLWQRDCKGGLKRYSELEDM